MWGHRRPSSTSSRASRPPPAANDSSSTSPPGEYEFVYEFSTVSAPSPPTPPLPEPANESVQRSPHPIAERPAIPSAPREEPKKEVQVEQAPQKERGIGGSSAQSGSGAGTLEQKGGASDAPRAQKAPPKIHPARLALISSGTPTTTSSNTSFRDPPPHRSLVAPSHPPSSPPHIEPPPPPKPKKSIDVSRRNSQPYSIYAPEGYVPSPPHSPLGPLRPGSLPISPPASSPSLPPKPTFVSSPPTRVLSARTAETSRATHVVASFSERATRRTLTFDTTESKELIALREEKEKLVEDNVKILEEMAKLVEDNGILVEENAKLVRDNEKLEEMVREGEVVERAKEEIERKVEKVEEDLAIAIENVDRLQEANEALSSRTTAAETEREAARIRVCDCEEEIRTLKQELRRSKQDAVDARERVARSETDAAAWKAEVEKATKDAFDARELVGEAAAWKAEVEVLRGKVDEMERGGGGLSKTPSSSRKEIDEIKVAKNAAEYRVTRLVEEKAALRSEKVDLVNQLDKSSKRFVALEQRIELLAKEHSTCGQVDNGMVKECARLRTQLEASEKRCEGVKAEADKATKSAAREQSSLLRELDAKENEKGRELKKERERSAGQLAGVRRKTEKQEQFIEELLSALQAMEKEKEELSGILKSGATSSVGTPSTADLISLADPPEANGDREPRPTPSDQRARTRTPLDYGFGASGGGLPSRTQGDFFEAPYVSSPPQFGTPSPSSSPFDF